MHKLYNGRRLLECSLRAFPHIMQLCNSGWESHGRPIRRVTPATGSFFSERKIFVFDVLRLHDFSDPRNDLGL